MIAYPKKILKSQIVTDPVYVIFFLHIPMIKFNGLAIGQDQQ
jgi:hypothetical protein